MSQELQNLPVELLEAIVGHLPSRKDKRSLWGVSRRFRDLLASRVFETITIRAKERALLRLDARPYSSLDASYPLGCLKLVKHLHLRAPFHEKLSGWYDTRCPHHQLYEWLPKDPHTKLWPSDASARLPKLIPLFLQLQENGLVGFSWDLGMCIPEHILGHEGYLTKRQTAIESLSLITGTYHEWLYDEFPLEIVVLTNFPQLRIFSWKGLQLTEELESLRGFFASNYKILEELELDFIEWGQVKINGQFTAGDQWGPVSFTDLILPHRSRENVNRFISLKSLALSGFGFEITTRKITQAFNIGHLQSLKLHHCEGILTFLSTIVGAGLVLRLKSLELIIDDEAFEQDGVLRSPLISFLQSFQGLEDLYIMLRSEIPTHHWSSCYWHSILHHSSTLRRLIYHERRVSYFELPHGLVQSWADNDIVWRSRDDPLEAEGMDEPIKHFYNTALAQMELECFGIADCPDMVFFVMNTSLAVAQNFKLLHFRRTATDLPCAPLDPPDQKRPFKDQISDLLNKNPASWSRIDFVLNSTRQGHEIVRVALKIFQSPKFNNLQVLAFGDFSHGGRYKGRNLLLCRAVTPNPQVKFRVMSPDDVAFHKRSGLLSAEFLTACSRNALLHGRNTRDFP